MGKEAHEVKDDLSVACPRAYHMGHRAVAIDETRARIVAAARELILDENALAGFSMELVARQAGVTRMTVYNRFGSRRGLLEALFDEVGARGHVGEQLHEVLARPDARDAMRAYIEVFCNFWDVDRALHRRLRSFAQLDAEFASAIALRYELHHHAIERLLRRLSREELAPQTLEEQVQTVIALTSFEFYDVLAGESRLPQELAPLLLHMVMATLGLSSE